MKLKLNSFSVIFLVLFCFTSCVKNDNLMPKEKSIDTDTIDLVNTIRKYPKEVAEKSSFFSNSKPIVIIRLDSFNSNINPPVVSVSQVPKVGDKSLVLNVEKEFDISKYTEDKNSTTKIYYVENRLGSNYIDNCKKTQSLISNEEVNQKIINLFDKAKQGGERAFMVNSKLETTPIIEGGEHSVTLEDINHYVGVYHNHTPTGIPILSPIDIYRLFHFIAFQEPGFRTLNSFIGVVGAAECEEDCDLDGYEYFNYVFRFDGRFDEAKSIFNRDYDFKSIREKYQYIEQNFRNMSIYSSQKGNFMNFVGLAKLFYKILDVMKIDKEKIILQRIDAKGDVILIKLDDSNNPYAFACLK